ncbi:MAG: ATP-dependent zinc metalloprotease FtsH [Angelakisella sp.]|nr:ATP-dependent zinc metalloprotease FtsH [Angelakisella sp.]MCI9666327.1 ATP-dependent zinc metalloprotease FtsH [Angelakisella sp.]
MSWFNSTAAKKEVEYNQIVAEFLTDQVGEYRLDLNTRTLTYTLWKDMESKTPPAENASPESSSGASSSEAANPLTPFQPQPAQSKAKTYQVPSTDLFIRDVHDHILEYNAAHPDKPVTMVYVPVSDSTFLNVWLPVLLPIIAMVALWWMIMRQTRGTGNPMAFAKAKAKLPTDGNRITFDEVAGADEEKEELKEIVEFLKSPEKFNSLGARIPKGVLLMGPPGTGKTLLAKAVAGEAGVPFFSISGSDFVEMYVGVGASRVRDLFEQAKKNAPSIVFIDEIDAVGRHRGAGLGGGHDEREQTLNQLLVEMDGFGANMGVIVMAATNRKDILDPALMRPGRFDRHITVNYPDVKGREEILRVHTRNKPIGPDVDLAVIAKTTGGFTGADLENLTNEAALLAARKDKKAITMEEIEEATIKVIVGPEKPSHVVTEKERKLTAYHESGHAIVTYNCPTQDKVHQVSIIPRGGAGGFTLSLPEKDVMYMTKKEMEENICTLLAGRVAESLMLDDISTGASNDIERATKIARAMVTRYGFSERLGTMIYGKDQNEVFLGMEMTQDRGYSEEVAATIDQEVRRIIDTAQAKAVQILEENKELLEKLSQYLLEFEKIDGEVFQRLMDGTNTLEELIAETNEANAVKAEKQKRAQEAAQKAREAKEAQQAAGGRPHFTPPFAGRSDSAVPPPPPAWEEEPEDSGSEPPESHLPPEA